MAINCVSSSCCKIDCCLSGVARSCDANVAGANNLAIAVLCAVNKYQSVTVSTCATDGTNVGNIYDKCTNYVTSITMNNPDITSEWPNGEDAGTGSIGTPDDDIEAGSGCPEHRFYCVGQETETLEITGTWTTDADTGTTSFEYSISGTFFTQDARVSSILKQYQGKELVAIFQEAGTDEWVVIGLEGGINFETTEFVWGVAAGDERSTTFTITGTSTGEHQYLRAWVPNPLYVPGNDADGDGWDEVLSECEYDPYDAEDTDTMLQDIIEQCQSATTCA